ncbi:porin [Pseudomonas sp.]|jgi:predicted porin|uniref:porin n=1 Tax=Pseudomonas sp. TaxID=306 RepID=UPI0027295256|nr:porin [Pseudomonas sp.]
MNKKNSAYLLTALAAAVISAPASAAITLYEQNGVTFSTDGYINAFYVQTDTDNIDDTLDRDQSRVKMGFLPNYIGFNVGKDMGNLQLGARSSFWVTINDSETKGTATDIDVRQFYGTIGSSWGEVLVGKDFGLFARSNIFVDEFLAGYGQVSDTLGLVDFGGVSFGNIGTGYPYPFPTAQITYRSPVMSGFRVAAGIMDPVDTTQDDPATGKAYQDSPRFESELTYQIDLGGAQLFSWLNGTYQNSKNTGDTIDSLKSKGLGYGIQAKFGPASLTASGFDAQGLNPLFTNNFTQPLLSDFDSKGHLLQGSYTFGKTRLALSMGKTKDDGFLLGDKAEMETRAIGLFHAVNDNLTLVAEYNQFELEDKANRLTIEETDTIALGVVVNW